MKKLFSFLSALAVFMLITVAEPQAQTPNSDGNANTSGNAETGSDTSSNAGSNTNDGDDNDNSDDKRDPDDEKISQPPGRNCPAGDADCPENKSDAAGPK